MNKFLKNLQNFLADFEKKNPTLFIVLVVLVLYHLFGHRVRKGVLAMFGLDKTEVPELEINERNMPTRSSQFSDLQAKTLADQLFNAMASAGTDEEMIYSIMEKVKSQDDYNKIYKFFGTRAYFKLFGETTIDWLGEKGDLNQWLTWELDAQERAKLRLLCPFCPI